LWCRVPIVAWRWSEAPLNEGSLDACELFDGLEAMATESSLMAACTRADDCAVSFDQLSTDAGANTAEFSVTIPTLRASVGVTYELEATNSANESTTSLQSTIAIR